MKIAAAYIRVSTDDQVEYSPASQLEKIQDYAKRNGYILPEEYIFKDEGISGRSTAKRPAFNQMIGISKTKPKPFDAILLWKYSRFARNREDSIVYKSMLRKQCGIDVISISEDVGDDKMSVLIEAMIEAMDEYYSINLAEEVKRGMTEKVSRGEAVTVPSYGYDIEDGVYVPNPKTAPVVREIFRKYLDGTGVRAIALELNDRGLRTRRGNRFENRTVEYILRNPVYIGKIRWTPTGRTRRNYNNPNTVIMDGHHEPLIDEITWQAVQEKITKPKFKYRRETQPKEPFMLHGLVRCSACGATLCRSVGQSLQCHAYAHGKCKVSHNISIPILNDMVLSSLEEASVSGSFHFEVREKETSDENSHENISNLISREKKKLTRVKDAYENGVYTLTEYKQSRDEINSKIAEYQRKLSKISVIDFDTARRQLQEKMMHILPTLRSPAVSEETKNGILKSFVSNIVFYRSTKTIDVFSYL